MSGFPLPDQVEDKFRGNDIVLMKGFVMCSSCGCSAGKKKAVKKVAKKKAKKKK